MKTGFVVIWSMHRGGGSLLAEAMRMFCPDDSGMERAVAPLEDAALTRFNESLFAELGMRWDSLSPIDDAQAYMLEKAGYVGKAMEYLQKFSGRLAILKDPRLARLGAFWRLVFESAEISPRSVVVWRDPMAVAASLRQRALRARTPAPEEDMRYGMLLWLVHSRAAIRYSSGFPRVLAGYEKFLAEPAAAIKNMAAILDFQYSEEKLDSFCKERVKSGLNHCGGACRPEALPARVRELYELLESSRECPQLPGEDWPETDEEHIMAALLDENSRKIRDHTAKMASIHAEICVLTGECKRMAAQLAAARGD